MNSNVRLDVYPFPLFFAHRSGSCLYDVDGNCYVDYALGMGPNILGHAAAPVVEKVSSVLTSGQLYAGQHVDEIELTRLIVANVPCAERVRFMSSGSEAVQAALRLARAATGRTRVVKFHGHYHGWLDNIHVSGEAGRAGDVKAAPGGRGQSYVAATETDVLPWNQYDVLEKHVRRQGDTIAAIIMEPIACNTGVIFPQESYLEQVRRLCDETGIVLIFDEIITGFRVALGGAQELFDVTPDLAVYAKALGNGFPIAAVAGRGPIMDLVADGVVLSGTYNANRIAISAALATMSFLTNNSGSVYKHLGLLGSQLIYGIETIARQSGVELRVQGHGTVFHTSFAGSAIRYAADVAKTDQRMLRKWLNGLQDAGVRPTARGTWFLSYAHSDEDIEATLSAIGRSL